MSLGLCVWEFSHGRPVWVSVSLAAREDIALSFVAVFTLLFSTALTPLFIYHFYLLSRGLTTFEEVKHIYPGDVHPGSKNRGCLINTFNNCCCCCQKQQASNLPVMYETISKERYLNEIGYQL
jgi:hypothetical protein